MKDRVLQAIQQGIPGSHIEIELQGNHCHVLIVSDEFTGLTPVKRQQRVYACIQPMIESGEIHAVNIRAITPEVWEKNA